jgi:hypothetical protein
MLSGLLAGTIASIPKSGTSASGTKWANCVVRCPVGQNKEGDAESAFVSLACFGDDAETLGRLTKGDSLTAQGSLKPTTYIKDGQERHGLSMTAAHLLTPYALKKKRGDSDRAPAEKSAPSAPDSWAVYGKAAGQDFNDDISF